MDVFRDQLVEQARRGGGVVTLGAGRRLLLPRVFGFCGGVVQALAALQRCVEDAHGRRVFLLGPVIHNDTVNGHFRAQGVQVLPEDDIGRIFHIAGPDDRIVMPAFGVPQEVEEALKARFAPAQLVDTTCDDVRAVWGFLAGLEGNGWTVVIYGKPDHPETRATLSRARRRAARVVLAPSPEVTAVLCDAVRTGGWAGYPARWLIPAADRTVPNGPVALVHQTTMLHDETVALGAALQEACREAGCRYAMANTVCRATQSRQDAAREICRQKPDLVLVVGSVTSSNTSQLYRLACACTPAYLIPAATALTVQRLTHWVPGRGTQETAGWLPETWRSIGILAGASCPATDVGAVIRWFQRQATEASGDCLGRTAGAGTA